MSTRAISNRLVAMARRELCPVYLSNVAWDDCNADETSFWFTLSLQRTACARSAMRRWCALRTEFVQCDEEVQRDYHMEFVLLCTAYERQQSLDRWYRVNFYGGPDAVTLGSEELPPVRLTKHAVRRARQRCAWSRSALLNTARKALKHGQTLSELSSDLALYVGSKLQPAPPPGCAPRTLRVHNNVIFVFADDLLITVLKVPKDYL